MEPRAPLHAGVTGTGGPDRLVGTAEAEVFTGGPADDIFVFVPSGVGDEADDAITDFGAVYFAASATGAQETPAVPSSANAVVTATLSRNGALDFLISFSGLDTGGRTATTADDITAAQFRLGAAGASGPVLFGFVGSPANERENDTTVFTQLSTIKGQWDAGEGEGTTLAARLADLMAGRIYFEAATTARPAGEIRGQLTPFETNRDRIDLSQAGIVDFADLMARTTEVNGAAKITVTRGGQSNSLTLEGVSKASLTAADFIFATSGQPPVAGPSFAAEFSAIHAGRAPTAAEQATLNGIGQKLASDAFTQGQANKAIVDTADADTAVAVQAYQYFTGKSPSLAGLAFLTNSASNPSDLNDAYYAQFNIENRYINFAANLGVLGEGAPGFAAAFGSLTFAQAVQRAYGQVIGFNYAQAAGINAQAAVADIAGRIAYFQGVADAGLPAANRDLGTKAAMVGYLMAEGIKADIGAYATASNAFLTDLLDGTARDNVDLIGVYAPMPPSLA